MRKEDIPDFVSQILATGAPMCAIGNDFYLICETEVSVRSRAQVATEVQRICADYGPRDHLRRDIVAHLRSLGRCLDLEEVIPAPLLH
jgi:hypothetical protein